MTLYYFFLRSWYHNRISLDMRAARVATANRKGSIVSPPFQLLRVITPGILWFNLRLYKPLTAWCESALDIEKCKKSEAIQENKWKINQAKEPKRTFANLTIRSWLASLRAARRSHAILSCSRLSRWRSLAHHTPLRKKIESENIQKRTQKRTNGGESG